MLRLSDILFPLLFQCSLALFIRTAIGIVQFPKALLLQLDLVEEVNPSPNEYQGKNREKSIPPRLLSATKKATPNARQSMPIRIENTPLVFVLLRFRFSNFSGSTYLYSIFYTPIQADLSLILYHSA